MTLARALLIGFLTLLSQVQSCRRSVETAKPELEPSPVDAETRKVLEAWDTAMCGVEHGELEFDHFRYNHKFQVAWYSEGRLRVDSEGRFSLVVWPRTDFPRSRAIGSKEYQGKQGSPERLFNSEIGLMQIDDTAESIRALPLESFGGFFPRPPLLPAFLFHTPDELRREFEIHRLAPRDNGDERMSFMPRTRQLQSYLGRMLVLFNPRTGKLRGVKLTDPTGYEDLVYAFTSVTWNAAQPPCFEADLCGTEEYGRTSLVSATKPKPQIPCGDD